LDWKHNQHMLILLRVWLKRTAQLLNEHLNKSTISLLFFCFHNFGLRQTFIYFHEKYAKKFIYIILITFFRDVYTSDMEWQISNCYQFSKLICQNFQLWKS
jgi:hypothetical protein